jgi:hypothetical protein
LHLTEEADSLEERFRNVVVITMNVVIVDRPEVNRQWIADLCHAGQAVDLGSFD